MIFNEVFEDWANEIKDFIKNGDTEQAVSKLGFLTEDFAKEYHQEAILIHGEYRRMKREVIDVGYTNEVRQIENQIAKRVVLLLSEIEGKYLEKEPENYDQNQNSFRIRGLITGKIPESLPIGRPDLARNVFIRGFGIEKKFSSFSLGPLDFQFSAGEITSITGVNGSGKSTLLQILGGVLIPDKGKLSISLGENMNNWFEVSKFIGYLPQSLVIPPSLVTRNVLNFTASIHSLNKSEIGRQVDEYLIRLGLEEEAEKKLSELSQGFRLRVELARVLILRPRILILDEPLANLDLIARHTFLKDLRNFTDSISFPMTTILSSHNIEEIEVIADNFVVLDNGKALFSGSKKKFKSITKNDIYEVISNVTINVLNEKLSGVINGLKTFQFGVFQILLVSKDVTLPEILRTAMDSQIEFSYIQQISTTTKSLLIANYIKKHGIEPFSDDRLRQ
ncbi:MAG TPA: ATP-binding cassette domain-containing protein [Flavilitoribacter sp.]|nr:ATP-binding cassette domain-containing protein [Flavilitoribacter sp.]